jgi:hypothetical protein
VEQLARTALYSRFPPLISQEELLKFYAAMKTDDPRRKQLEGKEGAELRRDLQIMYNLEHGAPRSGLFGPPGGFGPGGRGFGPPRGAKPGEAP